MVFQHFNLKGYLKAEIGNNETLLILYCSCSLTEVLQRRCISSCSEKGNIRKETTFQLPKKATLTERKVLKNR